MASAGKLIDTPFMLLLLALVWWLAATGSRLQPRDDTLLFGIALAGYTVQMLPWNLSAYYIGPVLYLFGLTLASMLTQPGGLSPRETLAALCVPVAVAAFLVAIPVKDAIRSNQIVAGIGACLQKFPGSTTVLAGGYPYVTGTSEGSIRIVQNIQLRDPGWRGSIVSESDVGELNPAASTVLYAVLPGGSLPEDRSATEVCRAGPATVFRLGS